MTNATVVENVQAVTQLATKIIHGERLKNVVKGKNISVRSLLETKLDIDTSISTFVQNKQVANG